MSEIQEKELETSHPSGFLGKTAKVFGVLGALATLGVLHEQGEVMARQDIILEKQEELIEKSKLLIQKQGQNIETLKQENSSILKAQLEEVQQWETKIQSIETAIKQQKRETAAALAEYKPCTIEEVLKINAARAWIVANIEPITAAAIASCSNTQGCPSGVVNAMDFPTHFQEQAGAFQAMCPGVTRKDEDTLAYVHHASQLDLGTAGTIFFMPGVFTPQEEQIQSMQRCALAGIEVHEVLHLASGSEHGPNEDGSDWTYQQGSSAQALCLEQALEDLNKQLEDLKKMEQ